MSERQGHINSGWCRSRLVRLLMITGVLALLSSCVTVPISGPVTKVGGDQPSCQSCVNVEVAPPATGDEPIAIVKGYLRATSNYQPGYSVARQFLTKAAQETWSPDGVAFIYRDPPKAVKNLVRLQGSLVGSLGRDRTFKSGKLIDFAFVLEQEGGEWRISNPPPGLLIAEYSFRTFYKTYDLYFLGSGATLVPNPIYLPSLRNPPSIASVLIGALINGPSKWLEPAVSNAIPVGTKLTASSVTITEGVAEVSLSDPVLDLTDPERSMLGYQIAYTLGQAGIGVKGVLIKVNDQRLRMPGADPNSQVLSTDAVPAEMAPISAGSGDQLYAVTSSGGVSKVKTAGDVPSLEAVANDLGSNTTIDDLAVSVANTDLAAVASERTELLTGPAVAGRVQPVGLRATNLLRPQFTRYGELWAVGNRDGKQHIWVTVRGDHREVGASIVEGGQIKAFRISPDGTKMALIRSTPGGDELGLARIVRADTITVDSWQPVGISGHPAIGGTAPNELKLTLMADVAWIDPTDLLVLGATDTDGALAPYRVSEDGSQVTAEGESDGWDAVGLAVLVRNQTAIVIGRNGNTWKDSGNSWVPYIDKVRTVAYPG